jgi:hypothetical protein
MEAMMFGYSGGESDETVTHKIGYRSDAKHVSGVA